LFCCEYKKRIDKKLTEKDKNMSIQAKMFIDDREVNIINISFSFHQKTDYNGHPSAKPTGGIFKIVFETTKEELFFLWMISNTLKNVKIVFSPSSMNGKSRTIELYDVFCLLHIENFDGVNNQPMSTYIEISPAIMIDSGVKIFEKNWKETDLTNTAVTTTINYNNEEEEQEEIIKKEETDYKLNKKGHITRIDNVDGTKYDRLFATDDNGTIDKSKFIKIKKESETDSTLISRLSKDAREVDLGYIGKKTLTMANVTVEHKNNVFKLFKFVADNSGVEWSVVKLDFKGSQFYNIATYHYDELSPGNSGVAGGTLVGIVHSHVDIEIFEKSNGSIDWSKSELKSMKYDNGIVINNKITYPYNVYFQQTKRIYKLMFDKNYYPPVNSSFRKSFKF